MDSRLDSALTRYRVIAYVVGVMMAAIVGPIHGVLYMVYLVITFDLAMRARGVTHRVRAAREPALSAPAQSDGS
jgi:hypothetical protein